MHWRNSSTNYGLTSITLHWLVAIAVFGLFGLGFWMVGLNYYSSWYRTAPDLHKSIGIALFLIMLLRVGHSLLYLGLFLVMISGYLISTADGRPISVFGLFEVPALITSIPDQADSAGIVHEYAAWALVIFAVVHALAALKHHFIDRDATLKRMLGRSAG